MAAWGHNDNERAILSRPYPVRWAGWQSTTLGLQSAGWSLAVERGYDGEFRLLIGSAHMKLYAYSDGWHSNPAYVDPRHSHVDLPPFIIRQVVSDLTFRVESGYRPNFIPVDARPCMGTMEEFYLRDLNPFNISLVRGEEVVVDKADLTVVEHLEAIKALQSPDQARIRQRMLSDKGAGNCEPASDVVMSLVQYR